MTKAEALKKLLARVQKTPQCWLWTAGATKARRASVYIPGRGMMYASRVMFECKKGQIPRGKKVLHNCDNGMCVRPSHLFLGTQKDNIHDMMRKGRHVSKGLCGSANGRAKVTRRIVVQMRDLWNNRLSVVAIAHRFKMSKAQTWRIVTGRAW